MKVRYLYRALGVNEDISNGCTANKSHDSAVISDVHARCSYVNYHVRCNSINKHKNIPPIISLTDNIAIAHFLAYKNKRNSRTTSVIAVDIAQLDNNNIYDLSTYHLYKNFAGIFQAPASVADYPEKYQGQTFRNFNRDKFSSDKNEYCHFGPIPKSAIRKIPDDMIKKFVDAANPLTSERKFFRIFEREVMNTDYDLWSKYYLSGDPIRDRTLSSNYADCCFQLIADYYQGNYADTSELLRKNGTLGNPFYKQFNKFASGFTYNQLLRIHQEILRIDQTVFMRNRRAIENMITQLFNT